MSDILVLALGIAVLLVPVGVWATVRGWEFARRYWPMRLPSLLAIGATISTAVAAWLSVATIWREHTGQPLPIDLRWFTIVGMLGLLVIPILNVAYLVWLDNQSHLENRRESERGVSWYPPEVDSNGGDAQSTIE